MSDRYQQFVNSFIGKQLQPRLGLPAVQPLRRYAPGQALAPSAVLVGAAPGGEAAPAVLRVLAESGSETWTAEGELREAAADAGLSSKIWAAGASGDQKFHALIFDATGIKDTEGLDALYEFFHPLARSVQASGRVIVIGQTPELAATPEARVAQRALEGFTRSCAKEIKKGVTTQLVYVAPGAQAQLDSTLRFLISARSAFVSAQVIRVGASVTADSVEVDWNKPLAGQSALVTGASRGIGEAIAEVLARDGAHVYVLDIPPLAEDLRAVAKRIGGTAIEADVTDPALGAQLAEQFKSERGGIDVVVHNAGVTRDKMLANMDREKWEMALNINLIAIQNMTKALLDADAIKNNGRVIGVASIAGVAGNAGQTNYATSKAGVIGFVQAYQESLAAKGITINAVAPGFIETQMTAAIPMMIREPGRRMASLGQGGLPVDVAETIAWYAGAGSNGVTGNIVRVCGQHLLGA